MHSTEALPLPPRPSAEHFHKTAKDLLAAVRSAEPGAVAAWGREWLGRVARAAGVTPGERALEEQSRNIAAYWSGDDRRFWRMPKPRKTLASAQFFLARAHGFPSWAELMRHIDDLARSDSAVARFEAAVDAIVAGDSDTLRRLLREHPELVMQRSSRGHGCTLLHYVSANGVEGYRQKTPPNIVPITQFLLDAGADVRATAHCYDHDDTTLMLTATSMHPKNAGVMIPLLETLVAAGADVHHKEGRWPIVRACLANGQPEAAAWLAERGAAVDLPGAAGMGRLDLVRSFVAADGALKNGATQKQLRDAWENASWYGETEVLRYLMDAGVDPALANAEGATALHRAAYAGHVAAVELLLARGAPTGPTDQSYGTTPLGWARHAWKVDKKGPAERYARIVSLLGGDPNA